MIIRMIVFESAELHADSYYADFPFIVDTLRRLGGENELGDFEEENTEGSLAICFVQEDR